MLIARPSHAVKAEKAACDRANHKNGARRWWCGSKMSCPCIGSGTSDPIARNEELDLLARHDLLAEKLSFKLWNATTAFAVIPPFRQFAVRTQILGI
jgi:hypothetical protein